MFGPISVIGSAVPGVPAGAPKPIDWSHFAARVSLRPLEHSFDGQVMGHFRVAAATGALTIPGAGTPIFSMRWTNTNSFFVLLKASMQVNITTAFTTPQILDFDITKYTAFSASDTGGALVTLGNSNKNRNTFNASGVGDLRVATTAALGAGTKVADSNPFGYAVLQNNNTVQSAAVQWQMNQFADLYKHDQIGIQYPVIFGTAEGFNIRPVTTLGAVGVVKAYFIIEWAEVAVF